MKKPDEKQKRLIKVMKTIGTDEKKYDVYEYQEWEFVKGMPKGEWMEGDKKLELENEDTVLSLSDDDEYDLIISSGISSGVKLKIISKAK